MKKLLVALLAIGSLSALAQDIEISEFERGYQAGIEVNKELWSCSVDTYFGEEPKENYNDHMFEETLTVDLLGTRASTVEQLLDSCYTAYKKHPKPIGSFFSSGNHKVVTSLCLKSVRQSKFECKRL